MKNKILIFTLIAVICISIFAVPCFAYSVSANQEYTFKEVLDPSVFGQSSSVYLDADFELADGSGEEYSVMAMHYRGYYVLAYDDGDGEVTVWTSTDGWLSDRYRSVIFSNSYDISSPWSIFFEENEYVETFSVYGTIYDLISVHLFGDYMGDSFVQLAVTLVSVILTLVAFAFPFGVVYMVFKFILTAIDRSI